MILRPTFYEPPAVEARRGLTRIGLDPKKPVGLVLFGGRGSSSMIEIAERLTDVQLISDLRTQCFAGRTIAGSAVLCLRSPEMLKRILG